MCDRTREMEEEEEGGLIKARHEWKAETIERERMKRERMSRRGGRKGQGAVTLLVTLLVTVPVDRSCAVTGPC
jgi:hypothetical protein